MAEKTHNEQKYENYCEQSVRLKRAMTAGFFVEAVCIEYVMIEDRVCSSLRHTGVFNPDKHNTLEKKLGRLNELRRAKKGLAGKYFPEELIDSIYDWKKRRNEIIHDLMNMQLHTETLKALADEGNEIKRVLSNKVRAYNNALERQAEKARKEKTK